MVYHYKDGKTAFIYFLALATFGIMSASSVSIQFLKHTQSQFFGPLWFSIVWALGALMGLWLAWWTFLCSRPVSTSDLTICNYLPSGRVWNEINWEDVKLIEQRRYFDPLYSRYEFLVVVVSRDGQRIQFTNWLAELPILIGYINEKIEAHDIRVVWIDRGLDTKQRLRGGEFDASQKEVFWRGGVKQVVTQLRLDP